MDNELRRQIWRNAFLDLDEDGEVAEPVRKIKSDGQVNRSRANRLKAKNPLWKEKLLLVITSDEYRKKYLESMEKLKHNETWRQNQKKASDNFRNDPKFKEKKRKEMLDNLHNIDYQRKRKEGLKRAYENPELIQKLKDQRKHQKKQVQTPDGIFESRKAAGDFYGIDPTQINYRMKKYPDQYFYIIPKDS